MELYSGAVFNKSSSEPNSSYQPMPVSIKDDAHCQSAFR